LSTGGNSLSSPRGQIKIGGGRVFLLELLSPIHSDRNKAKDEFQCRVIEPTEYAGATVSGLIAKIKPSRKANKKSEISLAFQSITMGGSEGRFDAQVIQVYDVETGNQGRADEEGKVKGKSKFSIKRGLLGALIGGAIGGVLGGPKGAAAGAAIGAGVGAASTMVVAAPDLDFKAGTRFEVQTTGRN
jgi:hypothetical protein